MDVAGRMNLDVEAARRIMEGLAESGYLVGRSDAFCWTGKMAARDVRPPTRAEKLKALGFFKDWTNALLVTTVAAIGWIGRYGPSHPWLRGVSLLCFGISLLFAMLTVALIPIVAEGVGSAESIYDVWARFYIGPWRISWTTWHARLKHTCWWQHVFFLSGIGVYVAAALVAGPSAR